MTDTTPQTPQPPAPAAPAVPPPPPPPPAPMMEQTFFDRAVTKQNNMLGNLHFRATMAEEQIEDLQKEIQKRDEQIRLLEAQLAPFLGNESGSTPEALPEIVPAEATEQPAEPEPEEGND